MTPRIDAHQHFWRLDRGDYDWLTPALGRIHRDYLPDDLLPELRKAGIDRTVLVQAAGTVAETRFMLELADRRPFIAGVVGWAPLDRPEAVETIEALAAHAKLVGFRPLVQDLPDDAWLLDDRLRVPIRTIAARGLAFDALVKPRHLPHLLRFLDRYPDLRVVVDHGAKPEIPAFGERWSGEADWRRLMTEIARRTGVCCKLSGLVTEAKGTWTKDRLRPYVDHLLEAFGAERLIFGSDWPVLELASDYGRWHDTARDLLSALTEAERAAVFGGNAMRFYRLHDDSRTAAQAAAKETRQ